jgi:glycerol dehydrogenase-like iron-containing ADH family enzyme
MQHEINPIASKTIENLVAIRLIEKKLDTLHISTTTENVGIDTADRLNLLAIAKQLRETMEIIIKKEVD